MWRTMVCLGLLANFPALCAAQEAAADKWEKSIAAFEAKDRSSPPPVGGIVFIGSSSIRGWDLVKSFPDLPAINRGFGGSQLADSVKYVPRIVIPYRPSTVVLYAGDNDIPAGKSPQRIANDFAAFVAAVRSELPDAKIIFLAIKPSPSRWKHYEQQQAANELVRKQCEAGKNLVYLDLVTPMLGGDGMPRKELFVKDQLHLSADGYALWARLLSPHLK